MTALAHPDRPEFVLPSPSDRPNADIVIFDGKCRFCWGQIERLYRFDRKKRLAYLSLHSSEVASRFPDLSYEQLMEQMYVVDRSGGRHGGADAIRYLARRLPTLWWALPWLHLPFAYSTLKWCYRQIAKRRYQLAGKTECTDDSCKVHFR